MEQLVQQAVRANIRASVNHLRPRLARARAADPGTRAVSIVGAEYSLETGVVEFFDGQT